MDCTAAGGMVEEVVHIREKKEADKDILVVLVHNK